MLGVSILLERKRVATAKQLIGKSSGPCKNGKRCIGLQTAIDFDKPSKRTGLQEMIMPEGAVAIRTATKNAPLLFFTYCPFCGNKLAFREI